MDSRKPPANPQEVPEEGDNNQPLDLSIGSEPQEIPDEKPLDLSISSQNFDDFPRIDLTQFVERALAKVHLLCPPSQLDSPNRPTINPLKRKIDEQQEASVTSPKKERREPKVYLACATCINRRLPPRKRYMYLNWMFLYGGDSGNTPTVGMSPLNRSRQSPLNLGTARISNSGTARQQSRPSVIVEAGASTSRERSLSGPETYGAGQASTSTATPHISESTGDGNQSGESLSTKTTLMSPGLEQKFWFNPHDFSAASTSRAAVPPPVRLFQTVFSPSETGEGNISVVDVLTARERYQSGLQDPIASTSRAVSTSSPVRERHQSEPVAFQEPDEQIMYVEVVPMVRHAERCPDCDLKWILKRFPDVKFKEFPNNEFYATYCVRCGRKGPFILQDGSNR